MSLLNFSDSSIDQLRTILGSYGNEKVGRLLKQSSSYVESLWFKVTEQVTVTVEGEDDAFEYKAQQVRMDGTLASNGIIFDSEGTNTSKVDDPVYYDNLKINSELFTGAVEVGKAYQVEFIAPSSYEEKTQYYIIPKGGGGGDSVLYAVFKNNDGGGIYTCDVYPNALYEQDTEEKTDAKVRVFNVDYGEVLNDTKLACWLAPSTDLDADYYAEAPTWQQEV